MKCFILFLLCFYWQVTLHAQEKERGVEVTRVIEQTGTTRALIVGISSYSQLPPERQLEFADKDAELFYAYIQQAKLATDVRLLTNKDATAQRILLTLDELLKASKPNDNIIFYFAGHGDVSKDKTREQDDAFLLCHNVSTDADYSISDAIGLSQLQVVIANAAKGGVSVNLITDACRSGKVATTNEAAMSTSYLLSQKWDKVMKLASCQENELSYESIKWGSGHGVFTWYLVKGLSKDADDSPRDGFVTLKELELYLKKQVSEATDDGQNPVKLGGDAKKVFAKLISNNGETQTLQPELTTIAAKRTGTEAAAITDPALNALYVHFKRQLRNHRLLDSADLYYQQIAAKSSAETAAKVKNEWILYLATDAQSTLDKYLEGGNYPPTPAQYLAAAKEFALAIQLYNKNNAITRQWREKQYFLEAFSYVMDRRYEQFPLAIQLFNKALKTNKKAAYIYNGLGRLYNEMERYGLSEKYLLKAVALAPRWTYPKSDLGNTYFEQGRWDESIRLHTENLQINNHLSRAYNNIALTYVDQGKLAISEKYFLKADSLVPNTAIYLANLGSIYLTQGRLKEAETMFERSIKADSTFYWAYKRLAEYHINEDKSPERNVKALNYLTRANALQPYYYEVKYLMAGYYNKLTNRDAVKKTDSLYREAIKLDQHARAAYFDLSIFLLNTQKDTAAAKEVIRQMLRNNKGQAEATYYLALFQDNLKETANAEMNYKKAIAMNVYEKAAYISLAELYELEHKLTEAEAVWKRLEEVYKESPEDAYAIGNFYLRTKSYDKAITYYKKALSYDPSYSYAWSALAMVTLTQTDDVAAAKDAFEKAVNLNPYKHDPKAFALQLKNKAQAKGLENLTAAQLVDYYQAAIELNPAFNSELHFEIANIYYLTGQNAQAQLNLDKMSKSLSATLGQHKDALQWKIYLEDRSFDKAIKLIEAAIESERYPTYIGRAAYYFLQNEKEKSRAAFAMEVNENPQLLEDGYLQKNFGPRLLQTIREMKQTFK